MDADGFSGFYDTNYATNRPTSRYFYDGQMGFEDDYNPSGSVTLVNRCALGARGIDRVERTEGSTTTYGYPLYDGHGNMRTTLARNGSGYTTGTFKTYDVWGTVRSGGGSSDPKQKYCGSLGHVSDDESGLTYMRARYYEPSTGRFLSEDPARDGWNWFVYANNDPVDWADESGRSPFKSVSQFGAAIGFFLYFLGSFFLENATDMSGRKVVAAAVDFVWQLFSGAVLTFWDQVFPTLNKIAKVYARDLAVKDGLKTHTASAYLEFWIGYGMFLAVLLDLIDHGVDEVQGWAENK